MAGRTVRLLKSRIRETLREKRTRAALFANVDKEVRR
jgi:hypothetical protein